MRTIDFEVKNSNFPESTVLIVFLLLILILK